MSWKGLESWLAPMLVIYLLLVGVGAGVAVMVNLPTERDNVIVFPGDADGAPVFVPFGKLGSPDQGVLLLAFLAGIAGSFLHAAQSLSSYVGNRTFISSWATWYFLRPWIGGILGIAIYVVFRSGLVGGTGAVNPYGVVALGLLGGWFSKTTTDKLQEVFETLFKTEEDKKRKDKLQDARPVLERIEPTPVPAGEDKLTIVGRSFQDGATVDIDGNEIQAEFVSDAKLELLLSKLPQRPGSGTEVSVRVKNPAGSDPVSKTAKLTFQ